MFQTKVNILKYASTYTYYDMHLIACLYTTEFSYQMILRFYWHELLKKIF